MFQKALNANADHKSRINDGIRWLYKLNGEPQCLKCANAMRATCIGYTGPAWCAG